MPTAERRRSEAARIAQARKKAARAPQAPPPPAPPQEPAVDDVEDDTPAEEARDPLAWRSPIDDPPFDTQAAAKQPHGPFELRLNGRGNDTKPGEIVRASWALGSTASGGRGWSWRARDGRTFGPGAVEAWRLPLV